jgi:mannan endo-1,4-beta-mannosidase
MIFNRKILLLSFIASLLLSCCKDTIVEDSPIPENKLLVDKNATTETVNLFSALKQNSTRGVMVGQQDAFTGRHSTAGGSDMTDMKLTCGKHPMVIGHDFIFITDIQNTPGSWFAEQEAKTKAEVIKNYNLGMIIHFTWHFRNPYDYEWFSVDNDPQKIAIANKSMASILPDGENHTYYRSVLEKIASVLKTIRGEKGELIPVIFRPFHEFDGGWFWWGEPYCTPEQFKANWLFTVEYMRDELNVHNVLYAFAPDNGFRSEAQYLERYPGDDYVDMVGMDNYSDFEYENINGAAQKLKIISDYAIAHNKLAALTECGYRNDPKPFDLYTGKFLRALTMYPLQLSFMMFWGNSESGYFVPTPEEPTAGNFRVFAQDEYTLFHYDVENVYIQ